MKLSTDSTMLLPTPFPSHHHHNSHHIATSPQMDIDHDDELVDDELHNTNNTNSTNSSSGQAEVFEPRYGTKHPTKSTWSEEEDAQLTKLVAEYAAKNWPMIASHLPGRSGKQCRERFKNHLDPSLKKGPFTPEEDVILIKMIEAHGPRWAKIAASLPGRTDNAIKNRYNSSLRRAHEEGRLVIPHHLPEHALAEIVPATPPGSPSQTAGAHKSTATITGTSTSTGSSKKRAFTNTSTSAPSTPTTPSTPSSSSPLCDSPNTQTKHASSNVTKHQQHVRDSDDESQPQPMFKRPKALQPSELFKCLLQTTSLSMPVRSHTHNMNTNTNTPSSSSVKACALDNEPDLLMDAALALCEMKAAVQC